ncbi:MAG: dihydromethanopterin reductase [Proteobacteria bacterium]|nr:dihydromethanopterin reductase [Pseudomonadota bacterium]
MSAETPSTESSTSSTSRSRTPNDGAPKTPSASPPRGGASTGPAKPVPVAEPDIAKRSRFAWCITGSGHYLDEAMALAQRLPDVDLFLSDAGEEVLQIYGIKLDELKPRFAPGFRLVRDKTASAVPVGMLYDDIYHTVVIAPATSNTVAKCVAGISDTLPTNMFAQAGKLGIPGIVFACDTEPVVITKSPHDWVTLRPRRLELGNVERLREIDFCEVVTSPAELEAALQRRLQDLALAWNTSSS